MQMSTGKTRKGSKYQKSQKKTTTRRTLFKPTLLGRTVALAGKSVGLGTSVTTVLRTSFFSNVTANAATGVFTGYLQPGSAFDPCGDLAGIQPQMYDQFAAQYNRYKVNSAVVRIKITGTAGAAANQFAWVAAAFPAVENVALPTYQAAASQQYVKTTSGGFQILTGGIGVGTEGKMLSFKLNHNAIVGAKSDTWDIGALVTGNPTALQFMCLPIFLQSTAAGASTWLLEIDMWQNVTFNQKKNVIDA